MQYSLGPVVRRCEFVSIRIPALPSGPLSVPKLHLEVPDPADPAVYKRATPDLTTLDTDEMQEFAVIPPLETQYVRVVCTENAAGFGFPSIGFFDVAFS